MLYLVIQPMTRQTGWEMLLLPIYDLDDHQFDDTSAPAHSKSNNGKGKEKVLILELMSKWMRMRIEIVAHLKAQHNVRTTEM